MRFFRYVAHSALAVLVACVAEPSDDLSETEDALVTTPIPDSALLVTEPTTMRYLENAGFSFADVMGSKSARGDDLVQTPFGDVARTVREEISRMKEKYPSAGYGEHMVFRYTHRLFNPGWLKSERSEFELIGVVNRLDRAFFDDPHYRGVADEAACGEVRLTYRLAYHPLPRKGDEHPAKVRLPMTINILFPQPAVDGSCRAVAQRWLEVEGGSAGERLTAGPLAPIRPAVSRYSGVEINLQSMHADPGDDTDNRAEYLLRAFKKAGDSLVSIPLFNTPSPKLGERAREALEGWIKSEGTLAKIDEGRAVLPDRLTLGTDSFDVRDESALDVTPRGLSRLANRPYLRLFPNPKRTFDGLLRDKTTNIVRSPDGLLRRLDQMTCVGCHETRAIAGFHLLGEERSSKKTFDALYSGRSAHLEEELAWRRKYLSAAAEGWEAQRAFSEAHPVPEHPSARPGKYGDHCGLPESGDATFSTWTCKSGLRCRALNDIDQVGLCSHAENHVGDPCEPTQISSRLGPRGDLVTHDIKLDPKLEGDRSCPSSRPSSHHACMPNRSFPGGMCGSSGGRMEAGKTYDDPADDVPSIGVDVFLASDEHPVQKSCLDGNEPLEKCLLRDGNSITTLMRACDRGHPCRDDYTCVRTRNPETERPGKWGACIPPYFVYQGRVDGSRLDQRLRED